MSESSSRAALYIGSVSSTLIALGAFVDASLGLAASIGGVAAIASTLLWLRYADRLLQVRTGQIEVLSPSPAAE